MPALAESNAPPAPPPKVQPAATTNSYVGILGVFLGAGLATLNARLLSVGLADLRGALGFGLGEASWLPTALNMATMFSGVFVVFVNTNLGPRKILLPMAAIFTIASLLLPFAAPNYWAMIALVITAGLSSGTFYSLTMTFVLTALPKRLIIFGVAAYAADIVFVSNFASAIYAWYAGHFSWHWIFWNAAIFTPLMMLCVYYGIPPRPSAGAMPNWRGFTYFSLGFALLYGAMDQGERLDWLNSGTIVAMSAAGIFLLAASALRHMFLPNPTVSLSFLNRRNIIILALSIFVFKFEHLASVILVPSFLANVQQYRNLETGHALAWIALPMFALVWLVAIAIVHSNSRLILAIGLTICAATCWVCAHLDSSWYGRSFQIAELVLAAGFACCYVGLVSSLVLEAVEAGALTSLANSATYSGFLHFIRLFGGQIGVAAMSRFLTVREEFHSNLLGLHVQAGNWLTDERLRTLTAGFLSGSTSPEEAQQRAVAILGSQVRGQAYTMAIADAFVLIAWVAAAYLLLMLFLRPAKVNYNMLRKMK